MVIDAKDVADCVQKYFGFTLTKHQSIKGTESEIDVHYDGHNYHFNSLTKESNSVARVIEANIGEDKLIHAHGDMYDLVVFLQ